MAGTFNTEHGGRTCFVTVGATASFINLVQAVLEQRFLKKLSSLGYSHLRVQYGKDGESTVAKSLGLERITSEHLGNFCGIDIVGFEFKPEGVTKDMARARGYAKPEGVVISHGGRFAISNEKSKSTKLG
jgi:beta-1,4-N-acetylglucosaminyltransferase